MKATGYLVHLSIILFLLCLPSTLAAALPSDLGISFGHVAQYDDYHQSGLYINFGFTKGLTERLELLVFTQTELTPDFLGDRQVGADLALSLLGKRWNKDGFAGNGINMLVSIGILAGMHSHDLEFGLDSIVFKLTPIAVGTPHVGKRDRLATIGIDWNIRDHQVSFIWNIMISDFYVRGTWRDDPSLRLAD
ncbi:MAG: hypothetical protein CVV52_02900 [Spirochaetae bacterium HGW-Spirochaetae-8]|nr:MAG: hypothetical protein CVV52_02900 [Spirochaetae bacterium HGW-Spirochaetae-8]